MVKTHFHTLRKRCKSNGGERLEEIGAEKNEDSIAENPRRKKTKTTRRNTVGGGRLRVGKI